MPLHPAARCALMGLKNLFKILISLGVDFFGGRCNSYKYTYDVKKLLMDFLGEY